MRAYVGVTDRDWFQFLRFAGFDEVNFWQPSGSDHFRALDVGQPFLFKLRSPLNFVVGGGFFAGFSLLPVSLAWDAFGPKNGVPSLPEMRTRIGRLRRTADSREDYTIGCIMLADPFFLNDAHWVPIPDDWSPNIVRGKGYDLRLEPGASLWQRVLAGRQLTVSEQRPTAAPFAPSPMFGTPVLIAPRLGQGAFRVLVTDAYQRRCAVTREKSLPVLEAAHIRPVSDGGQHAISNGLLLRSDIHRLYDRGYVTVTASLEFHVSSRLKRDFDNGAVYYGMHKRAIWTPSMGVGPDRSALEWHADSIYLG